MAAQGLHWPEAGVRSWTLEPRWSDEGGWRHNPSAKHLPLRLSSSHPRHQPCPQGLFLSPLHSPERSRGQPKATQVGENACLAQAELSLLPGVGEPEAAQRQGHSAKLSRAGAVLTLLGCSPECLVRCWLYQAHPGLPEMSVDFNQSRQ